MKQIVNAGSKITMTSLEIAELLGNRHDKLTQSLERLVKRGVIEQPPMGEVVNNQSLSGNNKTKVYLFSGEQGKRDSIILIAQNSPEFTAKIVDRWQELEQKNQTPAIPQNFADALQLAADQARQLEQQKPAVEFVQKYVEADSLKGFREVCKLLNANERDFRQFLVEQKIVYRLGGAWTAYKPHIEAGRMDTKAATANGKAFNQIMFTAKGVTWIAEKWGELNSVE